MKITSWKRALGLGFLSWLLPFLFAFPLFPLKQANQPLFDTVMSLAVIAAAALLGKRYFRGVDRPAIGEALMLGVVWLAINSTSDATAEGNKKWIDEHGLSYPILSDNDGNVGHMYDAKNTPEMYIVDKTGVLAYMGGIDNQPTDSGPVNPDTVNYVDKALGELIHGQSVSVSESQPYGCHVHYK